MLFNNVYKRLCKGQIHTVRRQIDIAFDGQEGVALAFGLELCCEFLG